MTRKEHVRVHASSRNPGRSIVLCWLVAVGALGLTACSDDAAEIHSALEQADSLMQSAVHQQVPAGEVL
jgi:hypothetical protein